MAVLSFRDPSRCRSRQLDATFNCPSANQVCWMMRFLESQVYSSVWAGFLNQTSSWWACSSQKECGSRRERSYISLYFSKEPIWAFAETAGGGGKARESFCKDVMDWSCGGIFLPLFGRKLDKH